jgi:cytidylate kinase
LNPTLFLTEDPEMAIVVISRQVGSYGDEIAALVAGKLNYELVDRSKVHQVAQECDPDFSNACTLYEEERKPSFFESFFFQDPSYTSLFESLTYELASRGNVVILGRGAQIVLRDLPDVFTARIVAATDIRVQRIMREKGVSAEDARHFIEKHDKQRRALIQSVFDRDPFDWTLYDVILNTSSYDIDSGAKIICEAVEEKIKPSTEADLIQKLKNMAFAKRVESHIKKHVITSAYRNITVSATSEGVVTLSGFVSEQMEKAKVEKLAANVPGVKEVVSDLRTTELSF